MPLDFQYTEIPIEDCQALGARLLETGSQVHFHVLSPGCRFNPKPDKYAFVIEDTTGGITYLSFSQSFPEVDKELTKMQFGDSILDPGSSRLNETGFAEGSIILQRITALQSIGRKWHHHMHFPECVLNPEKGKWAISLEEEGPGDNITVETFAEKPTDILREIEILYFENLES